MRDLLAAVPTSTAGRVMDLGCGPGNSTELLAARYPHASVDGLDTSTDMLAAAQRRLPNANFQSGDIATWHADSPYDVILSNAVLHWVPNHARLLPRLMGMLAPGGSLAIQMPDNLDQPSHRLMRQQAWDGRLEGAAASRQQVGDIGFYYRTLAPLCARVDIWRTTYHHVLTDTDAVVEWFKGSGLRPFLDALPADEHAAYLAAYRTAIAEAYAVQPDGRVLLPFPRLFIIAAR